MSKLYDEDIEYIADILTFMMDHPKIDRQDLTLRHSSATIYWAGSVLRIDIKGLDRGNV